MKNTRSIKDYIQQMEDYHYLSDGSGINVLLGDLRRWQEELTKIAKDLCNLTPGGSEFANDIEFCIKYLQDTKHKQLETIKRQVKRAKKAEAEVERLKEANES